MRFLFLAAWLFPALGFAATPTTSLDIGAVGVAGSTNLSNGVYTVRASGADIWGQRDEFRFVYGTLSGDGEITARVDSFAGADPWTKAGVMIRETLTPNSRFAYALISSGFGADFHNRYAPDSFAGPPGAEDGVTRAPYWVRLRRAGNVFTAYISPNGTTWTQRGKSITLAMSASTFIGLAVTSHNDSKLVTASFSGVNFTATKSAAPPSNSPPTISGTPTTTITQNQAYTFTPSAKDSNGDALTFSIANRPTWATFNTSTGRLSGTPTAANVGSFSNIVISVKDGAASVSLPAFSILVRAAQAVNAAPTITGTPTTSATPNQAFSFTPSAKDSNGDALTFSIANRPTWATFNTSTGRLSGTPTAANVGTFSNIVISVSDKLASASLKAFAITVLNTAPTIAGKPATSVMQNQLYSFTPSASDADGNKLTFSITNRPTWATFNTSTGRISGTPTAANVGTFSNIVISVSDGKTARSLAAFSIKVVATATGSTTLMWIPPTRNTDGSALVKLSGYKIYWGQTQGSYSNSVTVNNPGLATYVIDQLTSGRWYFAVRAIAVGGVESANSNETYRLIP